jgi:hypothetical protein
MKQKLKPCKGCGKDKRIFSGGKCLDCCRPSFAPIPRSKPGTKPQPIGPKKKADKSEVELLQDEYDEVFSLYIRHRGAKDGKNHCFTCGNHLPIMRLQCGHYESRRHLSTRWHEENSEPQCYYCNITLDGNYVVYKQKMIEKYGERHLVMLNNLKRKEFKIAAFEYRILIDNMKKKLEELKIIAL